MLKADCIFINGNIYTMEEEEPHIDALAIKDGKIIATGKDALTCEGNKTEVIDLQGKTMLPGFVESHTHPLTFAINLTQLDLRASKVASVQDILQLVEEKAATLPAREWILGFGWDETKLAEQRVPTIEELTKAAPEHPVFLKRTDVHNAVANELAFTMSGLGDHPQDPEGGHFHKNPETGKLSGLVQENAMDLMKIPAPSIEEQKAAFMTAQEQFYRWGITTIHDMAVTKPQLKVYQQLLQENKLQVKMRMWLWALDQMGWKGVQEEVFQLGIESGLGNDRLNVQGIKYMLDGSVGGRTAAVDQNYEGEVNSHGILYMKQDVINKHVKAAIDNNLRVAIHGIGERAITMALDAIEQADAQDNLRKKRHRLEHATLPTKKHLQQLADNDIIAGSSIGFIYSIGDSYLNNLGAERAETVFPQATFKKHGIKAPGNSDLPVCDGNPIYGVYSAATRKTIGGQQLGTKEIISVEDAFKAYTIDAAYAGFDEEIVGSIRNGKYADLIIVDQDPFAIDPDNIKQLEVIETFIEGISVYKK